MILVLAVIAVIVAIIVGVASFAYMLGTYMEATDDE